MIGALTVIGVLAAGRAWVDALIGLGCAVVGTAILIPAGELAWNYLQADKRLILDELRSIRDRLDPGSGTGIGGSPKSVNVRLALINFVSKGEDILRMSTVSHVLPGWTEEVMEFLAEHVSSVDAEQCLSISDPRSSRATCDQRVSVLRGIANRLPQK